MLSFGLSIFTQNNSLGFIQVVACISSFLLLMRSIPRYGDSSLIQPVGEHLGCFEFLIVTNEAAVNIGEQIFM